MALTVKNLDVRPSAGNGIADNQIEANLRSYCSLLKRCQPTSMVFTGDEEQDTAQVHQCAVSKGQQLDSDMFGVVVDWRPAQFHTVNANNSSVWDNNSANSVGVVYSVQVNNKTQYMCVVNF